ncbi:MAG: hypothetical protein QHI38_06795 [Armatimonadota bacterium]|nr:hypothetical protein [Armatimonadota bacterium]
MATMGAKRRGKIEGWELDVSETDAQVGRSTLRERLAASSKLWAVCFLVLVAVVLYFGVAANNQEGAVAKVDKVSGAAAHGSVKDAQRMELARKFLADFSERFGVLEARFVGSDKFRIVVPASLSRDDIEFLAKVAGMQILTKLKLRPVVQVYTLSADKRLSLEATARWQPEKYGFVVRMTPMIE